jgi:acetyl-CoA C-acetyltransferase
MPTACVTGTAAVPNGTYNRPERDLATDVLREAVSTAGLSLDDVDGIYMPKPRAWTPQGFFSTFLTHRLGLELKRNLEMYTGGTSSASAFRTAVQDVRAGNVEVAVVMAAERSSIHDTDEYFEYILELFDREFQTPAGPSIPGVYAQSLQRYCHDFGVDREDVTEVVVKNRTNAVRNPDALFEEPLDAEDILESRPISEPLRLYECPAPCDGAAALVVTTDRHSDRSENTPVEVISTGYHHPPSHFLGARGHDLSELPAADAAMSEALDAANIEVDDLDVFEPYAPFPHIEAILTEELGVFERGEGVSACVDSATSVDGRFPVSPSGGCLGRGHPAMVTPLLNYLAAVRQARGTAPNQVSNVEYVLTTAEHGHVDGVNATVFGGA